MLGFLIVTFPNSGRLSPAPSQFGFNILPFESFIHGSTKADEEKAAAAVGRSDREEGRLPSGWEQVLDSQTGVPYFFHRDSQH